MKYRVKNTLRELARHFGLKVKFVDYFDDQTHGKLIVPERRILINAHTPRSEHVYTLLHELGHFVLHVLQPHRKYHPWYFEIQWKINRLARVFS